MRAVVETPHGNHPGGMYGMNGPEREGYAEDIEWILSKAPAERQTALFSATMPRPVRRIAERYLKNPVNVEPSGWVFEYENKWNPDVDDTAMVLLALRQIPTDNPAKRDECFQRGLKWMIRELTVKGMT